MILNDIRSYDIDMNKTKLFGIKSAIMWGCSKDGSVSFPLLYFKKPKHISNEDYEEVIKFIKNLPNSIEQRCNKPFVSNNISKRDFKKLANTEGKQTGIILYQLKNIGNNYLG